MINRMEFRACSGLLLIALNNICLVESFGLGACDPRQFYKPFPGDTSKYYECVTEKDNGWGLDIGTWQLASCDVREEFVEARQRCVKRSRVRKQQSLCAKNRGASGCGEFQSCNALNINPSPGGACSWQTAALAPSPGGPASFMQCVPQQVGQPCGQWQEQSCAPDCSFNQGIQLCAKAEVPNTCGSNAQPICGCNGQQSCPASSSCNQGTCCQPMPQPSVLPPPQPINPPSPCPCGQPVAPSCNKDCSQPNTCGPQNNCCPPCPSPVQQAPQPIQISFQIDAKLQQQPQSVKQQQGCPCGQPVAPSCNTGCGAPNSCVQSQCCPPCAMPQQPMAVQHQQQNNIFTLELEPITSSCPCGVPVAPSCDSGCSAPNSCGPQNNCCPPCGGPRRQPVGFPPNVCPCGQPPVSWSCDTGCSTPNQCVQDQCCAPCNAPQPIPLPPPQPVPSCPCGPPVAPSCNNGCGSPNMCGPQSQCCPPCPAPQPMPMPQPIRIPAPAPSCPCGPPVAPSCNQGCSTPNVCGTQNQCCPPCPAPQPVLPPPQPIAPSCPCGPTVAPSCNQGCGSPNVCGSENQCCPPCGGHQPMPIKPQIQPQISVSFAVTCPSGSQSNQPCEFGCGQQQTCHQGACCDQPAPQPSPVQVITVAVMCPNGMPTQLPCEMGCPQETGCYQGGCCPTIPSPQPIFIPKPMPQNVQCPSGQTATNPCNQGCGMQDICIQDMCCPPPLPPPPAPMPACPCGPPVAPSCDSGCGSPNVCGQQNQCCPPCPAPQPLPLPQPIPLPAPMPSCPCGPPVAPSCNSGCGTPNVCGQQNQCCPPCPAPQPLPLPQPIPLPAPMPSCPCGPPVAPSCNSGCGTPNVCGEQSQCCPPCPAPQPLPLPQPIPLPAPMPSCPCGPPVAPSCNSGCGSPNVCGDQSQCCPPCPAPQPLPQPQPQPQIITIEISAVMCPTGEQSFSSCSSGCPPQQSCFQDRCCPSPQPQPLPQPIIQPQVNVGSQCPSGMPPVNPCSQGCAPQQSCFQGGCCDPQPPRPFPLPQPVMPICSGSGIPAISECGAGNACPGGYGCQDGGCCLAPSIQSSCPTQQVPVCQCAETGACPTESSCGGAGTCCTTPQIQQPQPQAEPQQITVIIVPPTQSPGAPCQSSTQCSGANKGCASCQQSSCQCTPGHVSNGASCVPQATVPAVSTWSPRTCCSQFASPCQLVFSTMKRKPVREPVNKVKVQDEAPVFFRPLNVTRKCLSNCTCTAEEVCADGDCLRRLVPGEYGCKHDLQCGYDCRTSYCDIESGQCKCKGGGKAFTLTGTCFDKCPLGTEETHDDRCKVSNRNGKFWSNRSVLRSIDDDHTCGPIPIRDCSVEGYVSRSKVTLKSITTLKVKPVKPHVKVTPGSNKWTTDIGSNNSTISGYELSNSTISLES